MSEQTELGARMQQRRKELGLSLEKVAGLCGITKSTVSRYENGLIRQPHLPTVKAIARALYVNPDWLLGKSTDPAPEAASNREIREILEDAKMQLLQQEGLMFDGSPVDESDVNAIVSAIEIGLEMVRRRKENASGTGESVR